MAQALSNIRVLDLTRVLAGPWCTQVLADLGAEVIKVERPGTGDDTRGWGPPWLKAADGGEAKDSTYFASANRGKKSVTVNIATPEGQAIIRELAAQCDVLIENYKAGDLKRYGLDYASLQVLNPRLIYCSITGYGQDGPYAAKPGYDFVFQGLGGLMSITGERDDVPGGGPQKVGIAVGDVLAGMYAAVAILAAVNHRASSGAGQYIDISLLDCLVAMGGNQAVGYLTTGKPPRRYGNEHPSIVPYQTFATADGHIIVAAGNDAQWQRYCAAIGRADLGADPRYAKMKGRVTLRADLIPELRRTMATRGTAEWVRLLEAADVPCGPINDYGQVFEDPQVRHRQLRHEMVRADGLEVPLVTSPIRMSATPVEYRQAPPVLGEHTAAILRELLGKADEEIASLRAGGIT
ncbi:MAG TPA: CaiB/BaiF CoA-transferase family protein [Verrucomicrobiae bacterium]|nr:CaiB/BaiF CoA-transferase family protein [Verrucomicrobiae bacterium]